MLENHNVRPAIKNLHLQHKTALAALDKIVGNMDAVRSKLAELVKLENSIQPALAVDTSDVESIIAGRLESAQIQQKREVIGELKADLQKQWDVLKLQANEQRLAVNRIAGGAWTVLAESLVAEHADLLKQIGQVCEKAGFRMQTYFSEIPYLTENEAKLIEEKEGFPQWL